MTTRLTRSLSLGDYIAANWLYQRKYWRSYGLLKVFSFGAGAFFLVMLILTVLDQPLDGPAIYALFPGSLLVGLIMAVVIPLISAVTMLLTAKRQFQEMSLDRPATYEFDDQGFRAATNEGTADLRWSRLYDFVQDRRVLLIRRTRRIFFILPKSQLSSDELGQIMAHMREAGVRER